MNMENVMVQAGPVKTEDGKPAAGNDLRRAGPGPFAAAGSVLLPRGRRRVPEPYRRAMERIEARLAESGRRAAEAESEATRRELLARMLKLMEEGEL